MRLIILSLCLSAAAAIVFDTVISNPIPYWENLVTQGISCLSECVLLCKVTAGCIGGRYQPEPHVCRLTLQHRLRRVMYYKKANSLSQDVTFGIRCRSEAKLERFISRAILGHDIKLFRTSSETQCLNYCKTIFWCRSARLERASWKCSISGISDFIATLGFEPTSVFWNRIC